MINSTIQGIFPTPIYFAKLERSLSNYELEFIEKMKNNSHSNLGNIGSRNTYVLNEEPLKNLKENLLCYVNDYFDKVLNTKNVTPYITQSWLNYTEKNQYHHQHDHPNSLVSGVFYISADADYDTIKFSKYTHQTILPEVKEYNLYNSFWWWFPVSSGDLILFPSSLSHSVDTKKGNNTRISLAFNVFIKGILGNKEQYTELIIN